MKVAFATTDGKHVDEHFGRSGLFVIYDVSKDGCAYIETRTLAAGRDRAIEESKGQGGVHEDLVQKKVDRLSDCKIVYLTDIGGPSAARLSRKGMIPIKVKEVVAIEDEVQKLIEALQGKVPPWLRKTMEEE